MANWTPMDSVGGPHRVRHDVADEGFAQATVRASACVGPEELVHSCTIRQRKGYHDGLWKSTLV